MDSTRVVFVKSWDPTSKGCIHVSVVILLIHKYYTFIPIIRMYIKYYMYTVYIYIYIYTYINAME
jgi:hypothetical protein